MKLVVVSHKRCWEDASSPSGYASYGGFPLQMSELSKLFDETVIVVPEYRTSRPEGLMPLSGEGLRVRPLIFPTATTDLTRKLAMLWWLPLNLWPIMKEIAAADVVHTPIPGDIGQIGMLIAMFMGKKLVVRHGGIWHTDATLSRKVLKWIMETTASPQRVMFATGYDDLPPSAKNPHIKWVFSTSLTKEEIDTYARPRSFDDPRKVRLVIVARQAPEKNIDILLEAFRMLRERYPGITLTLVGDGQLMQQNQQLAVEKGIADAVFFRGNLDHDGVMGALQEAELFVFPTNAEGFPKSILESLASGVPVVSTAVSVIPHLLQDGAGVLLKEKTPGHVAETVIEILENPDGYRKMSEKAIEKAMEYSFERWRERFHEEMIGAGFFGEPPEPQTSTGRP